MQSGQKKDESGQKLNEKQGVFNEDFKSERYVKH